MNYNLEAKKVKKEGVEYIKKFIEYKEQIDKIINLWYFLVFDRFYYLHNYNNCENIES